MVRLVDNLVYWLCVLTVTPVVLAWFQLIAWTFQGWLPVRTVDEPINYAAWTIADIPIEEIWPDPDDEARLLQVDVEQQLALPGDIS